MGLVQGTGFALPFRTASFAAAFCDKIIQHIAQPLAVVEEMARVVRPGGRVVLADNDWNTVTFSTGDHVAERRLVAEVHRYGVNGDAGRELLALLRRAGLESITTDGRAVILRSLAPARRLLLVDLDDILERWSVHEPAARSALDRLWADLERRDADGAFFSSVTRIIAVGQRV